MAHTLPPYRVDPPGAQWLGHDRRVPAFALIAAGADRPGIVAAVTRVLVDLDVNLADTSMIGLRGTFAMVLVVDAPEHLGIDDLTAALAPMAAALDLAISVRPAAPTPAAAPSATEAPTRHVLTVYGADHPGIVHGVAQRLADRGANVVDLETHVIGAPDRLVYAMVLDLDLPASVAPADLEADLAEAAGSSGCRAPCAPPTPTSCSGRGHLPRR